MFVEFSVGVRVGLGFLLNWPTVFGEQQSNEATTGRAEGLIFVGIPRVRSICLRVRRQILRRRGRPMRGMARNREVYRIEHRVGGRITFAEGSETVATAQSCNYRSVMHRIVDHSSGPGVGRNRNGWDSATESIKLEAHLTGPGFVGLHGRGGWNVVEGTPMLIESDQQHCVHRIRAGGTRTCPDRRVNLVDQCFAGSDIRDRTVNNNFPVELALSHRSERWMKVVVVVNHSWFDKA